MRWVGGCKRLLVLFSLCGALGSACGGSTDSDGSGGSSGPISIQDLPGELASAYCNAFAACCNSAGIPLDASTCRQLMSTEMKASLDAARPENYDYDAAAAGDCLDRFRKLGDDCSTLTMSSSTLGASCDGIFQGHLAAGAPCTSDIECAFEPGDDANCDMQSTCTTGADGQVNCTQATEGVCTVDHRGVAGDPCYWTCTQDGSSTACSGSGTGEMPGQSSCYVNDGLYCTDTGVCAAQGSVGSACTSDEGCSADAYCDFATQACAARLTEGQACDYNECATGLYCKDAACTPNLAPGSACDQFTDECQDGYCDSGTCKQNGDFGDVGLALACGLLGGSVSFQTP